LARELCDTNMQRIRTGKTAIRNKIANASDNQTGSKGGNEILNGGNCFFSKPTNDSFPKGQRNNYKKAIRTPVMKVGS